MKNRDESDSVVLLAARVSNRNLIAALVVAGALALSSELVLGPAFQAATGFIPLDQQFPLTREAIAIQLGAYDKRAAQAAYIPFVISDLLAAVAAAWAFILGWAWLFARIPNPLFAFLMRGAIFVLPAAVCALDIAENVGFFRLIRGLSGDSYMSTIELTANIHAVRSAAATLRDYLTAAFVLVAGLVHWLRRRPRKTSA